MQTSKKILVTGSRDYSDYPTVMRAVAIAIHDLAKAGASEITILHGNAPGADSMVVEFINKEDRTLAKHGVRVTLKAFLADWNKHGSKAGPIRNKQMVDEKPDVVLAFLEPGQPNRGTLGTVKMAKAAGIKVVPYGATELLDR